MEQSTAVEIMERSPSSPERRSEMASPPDSISSESNTSSDGFDHPAGLNVEGSRLTSYSSVQTSDSKLEEEEKGQTSVTLPETAAAGQSVLENGETTPTPIEPFTRVHRELISVETLTAYHIEHFVDAVSSCISLPMLV